MSKFINSTGIKTLLTKLKAIFASKTAATEIVEETDPLILEIDYESELSFNTETIVTANDNTSY